MIEFFKRERFGLGDEQKDENKADNAKISHRIVRIRHKQMLR